MAFYFERDLSDTIETHNTAAAATERKRKGKVLLIK